MERAADLFDEAADLHTDMLVYLQDGGSCQPEAAEIASALRDAAVLERESGHIFLAKGRG